MRCYAAATTVTTVPTALRGPQLEGASGHPFYVLEVGAFNTTTTAFKIGLSRYSASGTVGAAITEQAEDPAFTPLTVATGVNSTDATLAGGPYTFASIGAAIGAGIIWTFGSKGLQVAGTADMGMMLYIPAGTGQHFDFYWVWEE